MTYRLAGFRTLALASALAVAVTGCDSDDPTESDTIAGVYNATTFRVTPAGQGTIDVLAQGGILTLSIASSGATTGILSLPPSVTGGATLTESMVGTAVRTGNTVTFTQSADTFVQDLTFTISGSSLRAVDQTAGGANFTITLSRVALASQ